MGRTIPDSTRQSDSPKVERQRIEDDHTAIRDSLDRLAELNDVQALEGALADLVSLLESHFAYEEAEDGIHAIVESTKPRLLSAVQKLFGEHREFLAEAKRLGREAARALTLLEEKDRLVAALRDHEARETQLFHESIYSELGAGD